MEHADIERLRGLIVALPAHGRVALRMRDGSVFTGVIHVRGSLQVFRDPHGVEGTNAEIALECPDVAGNIRFLWLDQVEHVEHLDAGLGSES
ncbi:MAG: DUF3247 family protein [Rhodanobacter sp.]